MILWARKIYRILMGMIFPLIYYFSPNKWIPLYPVSFFLFLVLLLEWARKKYPGFWPWLLKKPFGKIFKKEPGKVLGTTYFLLGTFFSILFFDKSIAICVLLFNVFGDASSAIFGTKYGKTKLFGKKTLEGSLAFLVSCLILGYFLMLLPNLFLPFSLILLAAFVATIVELLPIPIDDNLTIPLITGFSMRLATFL